MVLRKTFQNTNDPSVGKLAPKWEGPYLIDAEAGKGAYWLATLKGDIFPRSWNSIHLKVYYMLIRSVDLQQNQGAHVLYLKLFIITYFLL